MHDCSYLFRQVRDPNEVLARPGRACDGCLVPAVKSLSAHEHAAHVLGVEWRGIDALNHDRAEEAVAATERASGIVRAEETSQG
jgi:hypothetical protein